MQCRHFRVTTKYDEGLTWAQHNGKLTDGRWVRERRRKLFRLGNRVMCHCLLRSCTGFLEVSCPCIVSLGDEDRRTAARGLTVTECPSAKTDGRFAAHDPLSQRFRGCRDAQLIVWRLRSFGRFSRLGFAWGWGRAPALGMGLRFGVVVQVGAWVGVEFVVSPRRFRP